MQRAIGWQFLLLFAAVYSALYVAYAFVPEAVLQDQVYYHGIAQPAQWLINRLPSVEHVIALQNHLQSAKANLEIVRGCDGAGVIFLLLAAILSCRAPLAPTLLGAAGAIAMVYLVNEARIVVLFWLDAYHPSWFSLIHVYVIPTLMILIGATYFAAWLARCQHGTELPAQA